MSSFRQLSFLSVLGIALGLAGCESSSGGDDGSDPIEVAGTIAADATWSGTVHLTTNADIAAGVDIHMAAGTQFEAAQGATLRVYGSLWIDGTAARPVSMQPLEGATSWTGITVEAGGLAEIQHATGSGVEVLLTCLQDALESSIDAAVFSELGRAAMLAAPATITNSEFHNTNEGAIYVNGGGSLTLGDCTFSGTPGSLVSVIGGSLTMSYCDFGSAGSSQHDGLFVTNPVALNVSYCNFSSTTYGVFIGSANGALLQYNNFLLNDVDIGDLGSNTAIDMRYNYWDSGTPSLGAAFDFSQAALSPIATAGPRT